VLGRTRITVVAAGVKSILDVPATLERLETLGVTVVGYRTTRFPGFYLSDSGAGLDWRVEDAEAVAAIMRAHADLRLPDAALLVANPVDPRRQLDPERHARALRDALDAASAAGVAGKAVTPFLLERFGALTGGTSVEVNLEIVRGDAALGAEIAVAWARVARR
jgi:pseudouridine-5'-phosphate glycosidase